MSGSIVREIPTDTKALSVSVAEGVGVIVTEEVREYGTIGYSIIEPEKLNFFAAGAK